MCCKEGDILSSLQYVLQTARHSVLISVCTANSKTFCLHFSMYCKQQDILSSLQYVLQTARHSVFISVCTANSKTFCPHFSMYCKAQNILYSFQYVPQKARHVFNSVSTTKSKTCIQFSKYRKEQDMYSIQ